MRREWTEKEEGYLISKYLYQSVKTTARKLNRSEYSVKRKAAKLGLNKHTDLFGVKTLSYCLNTDSRVIYKWIEKYNMPCDIKKYNGVNHYNIDLISFWKWAEQHKNLINWVKYERGTLPLEPEWVVNEKNSCKYSKHRKKWTQEEIREVKSLLRKGKSYREISSEMGRTYNSIIHLMCSGKVY